MDTVTEGMLDRVSHYMRTLGCDTDSACWETACKALWGTPSAGYSERVTLAHAIFDAYSERVTS